MARGSRRARRLEAERGSNVTSAPTLSAPTSAEELSDVVREAVSRVSSLRIVGCGSWLDANRPVRADGVISTRGLSGIVEYVPGDLTLTARAGTTLSAIQRETAPHGQWLTLDPFGQDGSIGATISTGSYGPLAHHFGGPRDLALGLEFVGGDGRIARGGGRVVKNVAGFDLTRLLTGSWGSLGVITEVTLRLRALPEVQSTLAIAVPDSPAAIESMRRSLESLPFVPYAAEMVDPALVGALRSLAVARPGDAALFVRLGGNGDALRAQRDQIGALGEPRELPASVWDELRAVEPERAAVVRLSQRPSRFADTWSAAATLSAAWPGAIRHGDPGRGYVRCLLPLGVVAEGEESRLRSRLSALSPETFPGTRIYERLPTPLWTVLGDNALSLRVARDVKRGFDPHRVLNPGILGEDA
jgi:glycolate dehydrogenase FAD-binding subunit